MRISDWSSDVCSSDLRRLIQSLFVLLAVSVVVFFAVYAVGDPIELLVSPEATMEARSEEHTSELQSLMRISYAVFCLKKKKNKKTTVIRNDKSIQSMITQLCKLN